ncbi:TIGR02444 family protein [uncultured Amphritea sp.]|uniref:TIGR02444 family protein n=1 Tax=Amphritea sp. TaxID=1872502 RepID=UPI0025F87BD4|nr:TIGR02444 family protein [uncultured Amphritea sp.]
MSENNVFWNYSVEIYSTPEMAELCLLLQNRYQLSVNYLLFALWLAGQGRVLPATLDDSHVREWRLKTLEPLRLLRYQLRQSKRSLTEDACYQQLKKAELTAERVESGLLYELRVHCPDAAGAGNEVDRHSDLNRLSYLNLCSAAGAEPFITGDLQALLRQLADKAIGSGSN